MRYLRGRVIFAVSLLALCAAGFFFWHRQRETILSVWMLEEEDWERICGRREKGELEYQLYFEGKELPKYSAGGEEGYLLTQQPDKGWSGAISSSGNCRVVFLKNDVWDHMDRVIRNMEAIPFLVYDRNTWQTGKLFVTSLPVMTLETERTENTDGTDRIYGSMTLFDIENARAEIYVTESACEFHVRGSASRVYYKLSYKLNLLDRTGHKEDRALLDMRSDDDWILRAMGLDESKVREKLATELWNEINEFGSYEADYIELFLDGAYQGLYLLQEPMDFKTLELEAEDHFLIQTKTWAKEEDFWGELEMPGEETLLECGEFVIDKNHEENLTEVYEILSAYKRLADGTDKGEGVLKLDKDNLYRLDVFLMAITAVDNSSKNQFLILSREEDGSFLVRKLPWDMDASFGQNLDYLLYEEFASVDTGDELVSRLMELEPEETARERRAVYRELRDTVLTEEHLKELLWELYDTLEDSGALTRENAAWDMEIGREQTDFIDDFLTRRLEWMDQYYEEL